jgi:hypothetical protein
MEGIFQLQWKQENNDEKSQGTRQHGEIFVGNKGTQTPPPPSPKHFTISQKILTLK